jgi:hypothetical protein
MPVVRVYVPAGPAEVRALREAGQLASDTTAFGAVAGATEEQEHAAWVAAADEAGDLVSAAGARRVVISADVDVALLDPAPTTVPARTTITAPLPLRRVVSFHVDEEVGTGVADLLWYDVTELADVARLLER